VAYDDLGEQRDVRRPHGTEIPVQGQQLCQPRLDHVMVTAELLRDPTNTRDASPPVIQALFCQ
jgi:hypothetical protein